MLTLRCRARFQMNDTMTNLQNWNHAVDVENKHNSVALFFSLVRSVELADRLGVDNGVSIVTMFTRSPTLSPSVSVYLNIRWRLISPNRFLKIALILLIFDVCVTVSLRYVFSKMR